MKNEYLKAQTPKTGTLQLINELLSETNSSQKITFKWTINIKKQYSKTLDEGKMKVKTRI